MPGINDSHLHGCAFGVSRPPLALDVGFPAVRSIADIRTAVAAAVARTPAGEWVCGHGWDLGYLDERRMPTRADLDAVSPANPVCLQDFSGHLTWANSAALARAEITADTPVPEGGIIHSDEDGRRPGCSRRARRACCTGTCPRTTGTTWNERSAVRSPPCTARASPPTPNPASAPAAEVATPALLTA